MNVALIVDTGDATLANLIFACILLHTWSLLSEALIFYSNFISQECNHIDKVYFE